VQIDDPEMRALLKSALERRGYGVEAVANGLSILRRVSNGLVVKTHRPPDLIISDIRMPGLTGLEALEAIQTLPQRIPVILITSFGDPETHEAARQLGAVRLLDKPFSLQGLVDAGYLRFVPIDPITRSPDTWVELQASPSEFEELEPIEEDLGGFVGIIDVRSGAEGVALDGTLYSDW